MCWSTGIPGCAHHLGYVLCKEERQFYVTTAAGVVVEIWLETVYPGSHYSESLVWVTADPSWHGNGGLYACVPQGGSIIFNSVDSSPQFVFNR